MKLLFITQKVDKNDGVLGFVHGWLEKLADEFESIVVVCLGVGTYNLPGNVSVISLGKESHGSKIRYLFNFYKIILSERKNYDAVFVHMNQIYVLLGWKFWRMWNKKIMFWRNHPQGNIFTDIAIRVSDLTFCTSPDSYTARFKKTKLMPVGIDTDLFKPNVEISANPNSVLYVGRISPIKNVNMIIDALTIIHNQGVDFRATIVGEPSKNDELYYKNVRNKAEPLERAGKIKFLGSIPNGRMPEVYNRHNILINLTPVGSLDKTIFEAMACTIVPIVVNELLAHMLGNLFLKDIDEAKLAGKVEWTLNNISDIDSLKFRDYVVKEHSLTLLAGKIYQYAQ